MTPTEYIVMILLPALGGIAILIPFGALASHLIRVWTEHKEQRWLRVLKKHQKALQRRCDVRQDEEDRR